AAVEIERSRGLALERIGIDVGFLIDLRRTFRAAEFGIELQETRARATPRLLGKRFVHKSAIEFHGDGFVRELGAAAEANVERHGRLLTRVNCATGPGASL